MRLALRLDSEGIEEQDLLCEVPGDCTGRWKSSGALLEAELALLPGLAIGAEWGTHHASMAEASYRGDGQQAALRLRGALPLGPRLGLAASGRLALTEDHGDPEAAGTTGDGASRQGAVDLCLVSGRPRDGLMLWGGAQAATWWDHRLHPLGLGEVELVLVPTRSLSAVGGLAMVSEPVGPAYGRGPRVSLGVEARIGQVDGISVWLGPRF
jgi:hypothetical protein